MKRLWWFFFPPRATKAGRAAAQSETFKKACRQIAVTVVAGAAPYAVLESRLRAFTCSTLLQRRRVDVDVVERFCRANLQAVDAIWRAAIADLMAMVDNDLPGCLEKELGIILPKKPQGLPPQRVMDKQSGGVVVPKTWNEGTDFEAV